MTDGSVGGKAGHRGDLFMRRAHGDHTSDRMQYNLRQRSTGKVAMASKGGNLFSILALLTFTAVAVYDIAESLIL